MPPKSYRWITVWFIVSGIIMVWDAGYCLMRPRSMKGGDLHWIWKPYEAYGNFDYVYGHKAYEDGDGFAGAAAILNLLENLMNALYLFFIYANPCEIAPLFGYTGATATLAKTILYSAQEYFCDACSTGHNPALSRIFFFVLPNIGWTVASAGVMCTLGNDIFTSLRIVDSENHKEVNRNEKQRGH